MLMIFFKRSSDFFFALLREAISSLFKLRGVLIFVCLPLRLGT